MSPRSRWKISGSLCAWRILFLLDGLCSALYDSVATAVGADGILQASGHLESSNDASVVLGDDAEMSASRVVRRDISANSASVDVSVHGQQNSRTLADAVILQWDNYPSQSLQPKLFSCSRGSCLFTANRSQISEAAAVSWYLPNLDLEDMPKQRPPGQLWAVAMDESPCAYELSRSPSLHSLFNIAVGISDRAQVRTCPHVKKDVLAQLDAPAMATSVKDSFRRNGTGLVAYIQSNCLSRRDRFVEALEAEGIEVDSLGPCRHNKDLPESITAWNTFDKTEFSNFERRYKFAIGLENCRCRDYVTEKLYRRLHLGVVPIYEPGPDSEAWLPSAESIINTSSFASIRDLAIELKRLDANATAYEELLAWKKQDTRKTALGNALGNCVRPADRCSVCDEVLRQRSEPVPGSTIAKLPAFGFCPAEKNADQSESEVRAFKQRASYLEFVPSSEGAACCRVVPLLALACFAIGLMQV